MNDLIFIRDALYDLKRNYGSPIDLYQPSSGTSNVTTGKKNVKYTKYCIRKAVHVPAGFQTLAQYTAAYIKNVSKAFAVGAYADQELRNVMIDGADIPRGVEILPEWYVIIDHVKYEVWKVNKAENNLGYVLNLKRASGNRPEELHQRGVRQTLRFTQTATGVIG